MSKLNFAIARPAPKNETIEDTADKEADEASAKAKKVLAKKKKKKNTKKGASLFVDKLAQASK